MEVIRLPQVLDDQRNVLVGEHEVPGTEGVEAAWVRRQRRGSEPTGPHLTGTHGQGSFVTLVPFGEDHRAVARVSVGDGQGPGAITTAARRHGGRTERERDAQEWHEAGPPAGARGP